MPTLCCWCCRRCCWLPRPAVLLQSPQAKPQAQPTSAAASAHTPTPADAAAPYNVTFRQLHFKASASPACLSGVAACPPTDAAQYCRPQGMHIGQQEGAQASQAEAEQDPHPLLLALLLHPTPLTPFEGPALGEGPQRGLLGE